MISPKSPQRLTIAFILSIANGGMPEDVHVTFVWSRRVLIPNFAETLHGQDCTPIGNRDANTTVFRTTGLDGYQVDRDTNGNFTLEGRVVKVYEGEEAVITIGKPNRCSLVLMTEDGKKVLVMLRDVVNGLLHQDAE